MAAPQSPFLPAIGYVGFGKQASAGVSVAADHFMRASTMPRVVPEIRASYYRDGFSPDYGVAMKQGIVPGLQVGGWLYAESCAWLLAMALGGADTTATVTTSAWAHSFSELALSATSQALPYLCVENSHINNIHIDQVLDNIVDEVIIDMQAGGLVSVQFNFLGCSQIFKASAATVSLETDQPMSFGDCAITANGIDITGGYITRARVTIRNGGQSNMALGSINPKAATRGGREIDVELTVFAENDKVYREVYGGASGATAPVGSFAYMTSLVMLATLTGTVAAAPRAISLTMNNIALGAATPNFDTNGATGMYTVPGRVVRKPATTLMTVAATNGASAAYI
jgi:hypothetical protein